MKKAAQSKDANLLRQKAEEFLKNKELNKNTPFTESETIKLIHELHEFQIELEMQNEKLMQAKEQAEVDFTKYSHLYDYAPSAYFTLSNNSEILELNLSAAEMLGEKRPHLINKYFNLFVSTDTKANFQLFLKNIFTLKTREYCTLNLLTPDNSLKNIYLEGILSKDGGQCLLTAIEMIVGLEPLGNMFQSEERYKSLFHNNHAVMLLIDPENGAIKDANPAACKYYGWSHQVICCKNISEINTLNKEEIIAEMQKAKDEKRKHFYFNHRLASGEIRNVEVNSGPIQFGDTKLLYSLVHDITDKKITEEKLKKSEETYRNLVESISEAIYEIDYQGIVKFISPSIKTILGYSGQEIIGKKFIDFVGESAEYLSTRLQLLKEKNEIVHDYKIKNKSGISKWIRFSSNAIFKDGNFKGASGTLYDITESKNAEEKLKISEENYRNMVESINDVVYEITNEGIIKYVSPSVSRVLGYTAEEVIGTNILTYIYDEDKAMIYERISKLYKRDYSYLEYRYVNKNGKICWVRSSTNAIIENGKMIGASGLLTDITERKQAEIALSLSEEKYSKAFLMSPYAILITHPEDGKFIEVNDAFLYLSGYSKEEALSDSSIGLNLWVDIEERNKITIQLKAGKEIRGLEQKFRIKNGDIINAIFSASIIYLDNKPYILSIINDITSRKQAEDKLRISEEKYRNIFENILDVYYEATFEGKLLEISPSIEFISKGQYNREELIGTSIADFYSDPEDRNRFFTDIKKYGKVTDYELSFYNKDGSIVPIAITSGLFYDTEGNPTKIIGSMRDITNRKYAENELIKTKRLVEESERKFKEIIQSQVEGIGFININEEFEFANIASATIFETEENELVGTSLFDYLHPDEVELIKNQTQKRKNRNTNSYELKIKTKKGNLKYIYVSASPKFDENDNYVGAYGIFRDITDRKKAESALQESEAMYRAIINASPDVITITDLEGKIIMSSPKTFEMFGYDTEEEIINKSLIEFIHNSDQERVLANLLSMYNGLWGSEEYLGIKKDGTTFDIEVNGEFIKDEHGQAFHLVFVTRDISERKQSEQIIQTRLILSEYAQSHSRIELQQKLLDELEKICNSQIGFFHCVNNDQLSLTLQCWSSNTLKNICSAESKGEHYDIDKAGVWVDCVREQKAVIHNDYLSLSHRKGLPDGHAEVVRELVVPVFRNEKVVAIVGVGNKPIDYTDKDVEIVSLLSDMAWDITERIGAEEELKKLSYAVEQSPVMICITDLDGNFEYANSKASEMTGYSLEELLGQNARILKSGAKSKDEYRILWETIESGNAWYGEFRNKRKNGELIWTSASLSPIFNSSGKIMNFLAVQEDITKRKQAEAEINNLNANLEHKIKERTTQLAEINISLKNEIEERKLTQEALQWNQTLLQLMSNSSPLGFLVVDNRTDDILYFNQRFCQIWGIEKIADQMQRGELKNNDIIPYCLPVLTDIPAFAESCKPLQEESNRIVIEDEIAFTENRTVRRFSTQIRGSKDEYYGRFYIFEDISQRKQSEEALKESREQLNLVIKGSNDAPWDWNLLTDNLFYSLKWWEQIGYLPEEIPSDSRLWRNLMHSDDIENINAILSNALNSNMDSYEAEFRLLHKKGHYVPVLSRGFISRDIEGKAIRVTGSNMDLTERKKAEKAIIDSEIKHASMISNISDVIGIMGVDGIMKYKSPNIERYFGWKPEDLVGKEGWFTIHPDDMEYVKNEYIKLLEKDNFSVILEYRYKCKDETYKLIELTATNLVNDPIINGILLNYHDITERKKAENALKESEARFSSFMDYLPVVAFLKDQNGKTLFVNKYMDIAFGASKWVGKTMLEVFPGEFGEKLTKDDIESMKLGYHKIDESLLQLDGKLHDFETQKFLISIDGKEPILGGISMDITERKLAEEKILEARDEAEKANLAKSEFLSRMSHELRTPMNSILGFAQLLEMGQLDVKQKKGVHHILQSGKHLLDMINEVLDISRIEAGYLSLLMEAIQVRGLVSDCLDIIQPIAAKKNICIQFSDFANNLVCVYADSQRLKQVLINLLNNAVKYNQIGGSVSVDCKEIPANNDGISNLRILITDTGSGIPSENLDKIFLPFERIGAEKTEVEGTGLGLSVVKKLIDAMKGSIGIESKFGEGSCFWIELPIIENSLDTKKKNIENYKLTTALGIVKKENALQSQEITDQTTALKLANTEIESQKIEKAKRAAELLIANRDLVLKNKEEVKLAAELLLAYKTIDIQNDEKAKLAAELVIANLEMLLQSEEKEKLQSEFLEKIRELTTQNKNLMDTSIDKTAEKHCILYIEDNVSNIELVNQILTSHRPAIRLIANKNGKKALEMAILYKPAFILLDLNLPDIHCKDVLQLLQNDERTKDIPVVIISADVMPLQIEQLKKAGSKDYLCKPLDVNTLLDVVDKWIDNKK
ncbi:MAG: PAS domain S-box protein [Bacteroidetes bacterium]|nr:PAS domain S-box protein [Bacteroidota bacterium]